MRGKKPLFSQKHIQRSTPATSDDCGRTTRLAARRQLIVRTILTFLFLSIVSQPLFSSSLDAINRNIKIQEIQALRTGGASGYGKLALSYLSRARLVGDWNDVSSAESALAKAQRIDAKNPETLWAAINIHLYQHQFSDMLRSARKMVLEHPNDARGYGGLGDALFELGNLDEARKAYEQMAEINRGFDALVRLARAQDALGNSDDAIRLMQQAKTFLAPEDSRRNWAEVMLAAFEMGQGNLSEAINTLEIVVSDSPEDYFALEHLAEANSLLQNYEKADQLYARVFQIRPEPVFARAWAEVKRARNEHAFADTLDAIAERALRSHVEAGRIAYFRELADFYLSVDRESEQALQLAKEDFKIRQDTGAYEILARAWLANNDLEKAQKYIAIAVSRPDAGSMTFYHAGKIFQAAGNLAKAQACMKKALAQNAFFGAAEKSEAQRLCSVQPSL